jgi:uroporphyrinogen-III decarboxylase
VAIWGNPDPVAVLARGTVDQVRQATGDLLKAVQQCGHPRFVLSSGCALAVDTPRENLHTMFDVARQYV